MYRTSGTKERNGLSKKLHEWQREFELMQLMGNLENSDPDERCPKGE